MRLMLTLLICLLFVGEASAQRRYRVKNYNSQAVQVQSTPQQITETCEDALKEVNQHRAKLGLKPFVHDELLTKAAYACAKERCKRGIHGHLPESDFSYLPSGGNATAAGCGALEPSWGWGTCCAEDNYTYAGAAWVKGSDGRRYMHLFVR